MLTRSWVSVKDAYKQSGDKRSMYERWNERNTWVFGLVQEVFLANEHTINDALTFTDYHTQIEHWQHELKECVDDNAWTSLEEKRPKLIIREISNNKTGSKVFEFPYADSLTSDLDIQFNVHHMSETEFNSLKRTIVTRCETLCLSRYFDLNVYIEGDVQNYPPLDLTQCKQLLRSKLSRFGISLPGFAKASSPENMQEVEQIYTKYYQATLKDPAPLHEELEVYKQYFAKWEAYKSEPNAMNLALFHYLKIEGYVCAASLQFVLEMKRDDQNFYHTAALENLCDAVIHMSSTVSSFLDKSKYLKRCALALKSCSCDPNEFECRAYSCRQQMLDTLMKIAGQYDTLRKSTKRNDMETLKKMEDTEAPFFISMCASVIKNVFVADPDPYAKLTTTLADILQPRASNISRPNAAANLQHEKHATAHKLVKFLPIAWRRQIFDREIVGPTRVADSNAVLCHDSSTTACQLRPHASYSQWVSASLSSSSVQPCTTASDHVMPSKPSRCLPNFD